MKKEEALQNRIECLKYLEGCGPKANPACVEAVRWSVKALQGPTRYDVEKAWKGEWVIGEPDCLGTSIHCSRCGWGSDYANQKKWTVYKGHIFCGNCGAPMTDKAVDIIMERLKELSNEDNG